MTEKTINDSKIGFCLLKSHLIAQFHQNKCDLQLHTVYNGRGTRSSLPFLDAFIIRQSHKLHTHRCTRNLCTRVGIFTTIHTTSSHQKLPVAKHCLTELKHTTRTNKIKYTRPTTFFLCYNLMVSLFVANYANLKVKHSSTSKIFQYFITIPYIQGVSKKIQRALNNVEIKVAMRLIKTIIQFLS